MASAYTIQGILLREARAVHNALRFTVRVRVRVRVRGMGRG